MSRNTKNTKTALEQINTVAQQAGLILMTAAATVGMLELPDHSAGRIIVPNQPALALAGENAEVNNNTLRREKEEVEQHYISYSVTQRTPARSGKH